MKMQPKYQEHSRVTIVEKDDSLILTSSWRSCGFMIGLIVVGIIVLPFLAIGLAHVPNDSGVWAIIVLGLLLYAGLIYVALAIGLNRTIMTITPRTLSLKTGPFPLSLFPNTTIPTAAVIHLYYKRVVVLVSKGGRPVAVSHELRAFLRTTQHLTLFEFDSPEEAFYAQERIEAWLQQHNFVLKKPLQPFEQA